MRNRFNNTAVITTNNSLRSTIKPKGSHLVHHFVGFFSILGFNLTSVLVYLQPPPLPLSLDRLHYDNVTNTYHNTEGVKTRVPAFGNTSSIEYLDPNAKYFGPAVYFNTMVS